MGKPPHWSGMTDHAKACYLCDTHQAKDYGSARRMVWRDAHPKKPRLLTESVRRPGSYWWQKD